MKKKLAALILIAVIASAGFGVVYANPDPSSTAECWCDVSFTDVVCADNEFGIDVAVVSAQLVSDISIVVTISNAYPGYEAYINYTITNTDEIPIYVNGVTIENYNETAINVTESDINEGMHLYNYGDTMNGNLTIRVLDGAMQNSQYLFNVNINFCRDAI